MSAQKESRTATQGQVLIQVSQERGQRTSKSQCAQLRYVMATLAVKLQTTIGRSTRSGLQTTQPSAEKKSTRVESDAGRPRRKLQENAYEGVIGARCARQPPFARCGERVTMLTLHCPHPECHHCTSLTTWSPAQRAFLASLSLSNPSIFTFMPSFGPACFSPDIVQRLTSRLRSTCSS